MKKRTPADQKKYEALRKMKETAPLPLIKKALQQEMNRMQVAGKKNPQ